MTAAGCRTGPTFWVGAVAPARLEKHVAVSGRTGEPRGDDTEPMTGGTGPHGDIAVGGRRSGDGTERIVVALRDGPGAELLLRRATALFGRGGLRSCSAST
jgi:hypothetical protein